MWEVGKRPAGRAKRVGIRAALVVMLSIPLAWGSVSGAGTAGAHSCSLCIHFVTTYDPDGPGGNAGKKRLQDGILVDVPYALDVNGNKAPVPLGILPALPGYEVSVTVLATSAEQPTITIKKMLNAPPVLPLRIEAVTGDIGTPSAKKTSFGYDTLDSTAPMMFTAKVDIRDTDNNPNTSRATLGLMIAGAGQRLGIVNEDFTGPPVGGRTNRHIRRATFVSGGTSATSVPMKAHLLVFVSDTHQRIRFRTDKRSGLEFALSEPDGSVNKGTISNLPFFARVDITKKDATGDSLEDLVVDYRATNRVGHATIDSFNGISGIETDIAVDALPKEAHVVYATPPGQNRITYSASERAGRAQVDVLGGDAEFTAIMENLPTNITELAHTSQLNGGKVTYHADARADLVQVENREEGRELIASANTVPANVDELDYATPPNVLSLDYLADATTPHVQVSVAEDIFPTIGDPHHRTFVASADDFASEFHFDLNTPEDDDTTVDYTASDPMTRVEVTGDDEVPLFARATALDLVMETLPLSMHGAFGNDHVLVDPLGGRIGKAEFLAEDTGEPPPAESDPLDDDPDQDGLFLDDDPEGIGTYRLHARVHDLQKLDAVTAPNLDALLDTASDPLRSFDINLHYPTEDFNDTQRLTGSIDTLRPSTEIFVGAENEDTDLVSYDDAGTGNGPTIELDGQDLEWLPSGNHGIKAKEVHIGLVGMPRHMAYRHATDASLPEEERNGLPMDVETSGGSLDRADIQLTSGPDERLPDAENGFYMRDLADKFVIFARGRNFESFHTDRPTDQELELTLDAPDTGPAKLDIVKDIRSQLWESFSTRDGTETITGSMPSVPANIDLSMKTVAEPAKKELTYTADETAASFDFSDTVQYRGPELEAVVDYVNNFLNDHAPTNFLPSDFDSSQTLGLTPMPKFFHVCQLADGNSCTSDVFTGGMFDEFSPSSANGGSIRFQADPRAHFAFHDSSPARVDFFYNRVNEEPPNGCQAGEQPGPNTTDPSMPLDCEGGDVKPGRATADIELDLNNLAIQTHQEDAGFVGSVVGYPDQGYIALDTGWEAGYISCLDTRVFLGDSESEAESFCEQAVHIAYHGHHTPPLVQRVTGEIVKGGDEHMASEDDLYGNWEADFDRFGAVIDTVDLEFGAKLGLDHRIFEYDPDELLFAKTFNGHSFCESDTHLEGSGTDFTDLFCEGGFSVQLP